MARGGTMMITIATTREKLRRTAGHPSVASCADHVAASGAIRIAATRPAGAPYRRMASSNAVTFPEPKPAAAARSISGFSWRTVWPIASGPASARTLRTSGLRRNPTNRSKIPRWRTSCQRTITVARLPTRLPKTSACAPSPGTRRTRRPVRTASEPTSSTGSANIPLTATILWGAVQLALGQTVYRQETWTELLKWTTNLVLFFLALQV